MGKAFKNNPGYFITGTDTDVGKTMVTLGLMQYLQQQGKTVAAMKPVASGCEQTSGSLRNDDAVQLLQQSSIRLAYDLVNPYAFEPAIAPHIAAAQCGVRIELEKIQQAYTALTDQADCVLVEGVGGWQVPLNGSATMADLAVQLGLDVILVVGMRLGCLNHALLTVTAIQSSGLKLAGWVANCLPSIQVEATDENINTLKSMISEPLLGIVPALPEVSPKAVAACLSFQHPSNT
jgi:dethiobiotin synthetase